MYCKSLVLAIKSPNLLNQVSDNYLSQLQGLFKVSDLDHKIKVSLVEVFLSISNLLHMRKSFLRPSFYEILVEYALQIKDHSAGSAKS